MNDAAQERAQAILNALQSGDKERRNAAIIQLAQADEETSRIIEEATARAVEEWQGEEDDLMRVHRRYCYFWRKCLE